MSKPPALRRIQADIRELSIDPSDQYAASPLEDDMFEWHFTIRGAPDTDFEGGIYHGRILLPKDYPFKPPNIVFLTPSGRFETGVKVCLSFSAHHPELWQPAWGIRLILEALISFLPTPADGAIGALDWSSAERKKLAKKSREYCCPSCGPVADLIPEIGSVESSGKKSRFQAEIQKLHELQALNERKEKPDDGEQKALVTSEEFAKGDEDSRQLSAEVTTEETTKNTSEIMGDVQNKLCIEEIQSEQTTAQLNTGTVLLANASKSDASSTLEKPMQQNDTVEEEVAHESQENAVTSVQVNSSIPVMSDPLVHGILVCLVAIVAILFCKIQSLMAELKALDGTNLE